MNRKYNSQKMKASINARATNLDFNKPSIDMQKSMLYYAQTKCNTKLLTKAHDTYLTACPVYVPALQK